MADPYPFNSEEGWRAANKAVEAELNEAVHQGYVTWVNPFQIKSLAERLVKTAVLAAQDPDSGDITDLHLADYSSGSANS